MRLEEYRTEIEAAKLSLEVLVRRGIDVEAVFLESIQGLQRLPGKSQEPGIAQGAVILLCAWLEMGFPYGMHGELFDQVLEKAGLGKSDVVRDDVREMRQIRLTRGQVRSMLDRWSNSSRNPMTIENVVEDIVSKVSGKETGMYYYRNYHAGPGRLPDIYELAVREDGSYFHDIRRGRRYQLKEREKKDKKG